MVAAAEPDPALARVVKAVFLYKFLNYAEWPAAAFAQPESPYVIGVYGADEIAAELAQLAAGRTVADRPVQIRKVRRGDPLAGVHVLFVGAPENAQVAALARAARQQGILVVSEAGDGLAQGSAINLLIVDGRVRFDVAVDAAEKAGVRLSSRLLAVARSVRGAGG